MRHTTTLLATLACTQAINLKTTANTDAEISFIGGLISGVEDGLDALDDGLGELGDGLGELGEGLGNLGEWALGGLEDLG